MQVKTVMGFDYGTKKVAVAIGNMVTTIATPISIVRYKKTQLLWHSIQQLLTQWQPQLLVVGLPVYEDKSLGDMARAAQRFGNRLQGRFHLPVTWVDETLSSYTAKATHFDNEIRAHGLDAIAAKLLLDTWFEMEKDKPI